MKFRMIYRASSYAMLACATLVLSIDATTFNPLSMLYPVVVAAAAVIAFLTVDRDPRLGLSRTAANWIAAASIPLCLFEWSYDPDNLLLLATAHALVYLQLVKMFLPKTVTDDWFLFLLGLIQVLVGGVMSQSDQVGVALFAWALLALWVLTLFALHRESLRMGKVPIAWPGGANADRSEPYRGLIDVPFVVSTARVAAMTLALGGLIFLAMPRKMAMGGPKGGGPVGRHLSGFDDEVRLGQLGEILENDSPVMNVELTDNLGVRLRADPDIEYRWRGVTLDKYQDRKWFRASSKPDRRIVGLAERFREGGVIRQSIKMEPTDNPVLFGLRPIFFADAATKQNTPEMNEVDGSFFRPDTKVASFDYVFESSDRPDLPQPGESRPSTGYLKEKLLSMPAGLKARLRPIALEQVGAIDPARVRDRALALEAYLRDSGKFTYSLQINVTDPNLDPVEDFLTNERAGHCEYFASALALLLRSIDIPTRMVNGFKGGDYNAITGVTTVRQKHAHSWVEALVDDGKGPNPDRMPTWLTLDPTPSAQREASVAQVGGLASNFYQLTDFVRYIWIFYIVGFNSDRQERFLYGPIRELILEARRGFGKMWEWVEGWFHFPSVESFFSPRGFVVSFLALLVAAGLIRAAVWAFHRAFRRLAGAKAEGASGSANVQFYRRLVQLLGEYGLERPPAETPREFARRAALFLAGHGSGAEAVADVPPLVVDAFYRVRFGEHAIRDDDFDLVNARLDALEARLHPVK